MPARFPETRCRCSSPDLSPQVPRHRGSLCREELQEHWHLTITAPSAGPRGTHASAPSQAGRTARDHRRRRGGGRACTHVVREQMFLWPQKGRRTVAKALPWLNISVTWEGR